MRWYILRALIQKEALRHVANRGGLVLAMLLVGLGLLLALGRSGSSGTLLASQVPVCFFETWPEDQADPVLQGWLNHLRQNQREGIRFRTARRKPSEPVRLDGMGGIIQLRPLPPTAAPDDGPAGLSRYQVAFWFPGDDPNVLAPFEAWFWRETRNHFDHAPSITEARQRIEASADTHSVLATALVVFALFLTCVYLLPSMTCEERERGILLAQALSPAAPLEILAARFLFYPLAGILLGAMVAGPYRPGVLLMPFFWLTLVALSVAWLGIGMTIASLARTQRLASLGAMCYLILLSLFILTVQQVGLTPLLYLLVEFYGPRALQHALADTVDVNQWVHLSVLMTLAGCWTAIATWLFRRCGWQ